MALLSSCSSFEPKSIKPVVSDELVLTEGLNASRLITWMDPISDADYFGYDNSTLALVEADGQDVLVVGHEGVVPTIVSNYDEKTRARLVNQITMEMYQVGASVVQLSGWWSWNVDFGAAINKRFTATTQTPYERLEVDARSVAPGIAGIASSAVTPWGTVLLGEGDFQKAFGDVNYQAERFLPSELQWESFTGVGPQHFGWIVELDPVSGVTKKWTSMGRFDHSGLAIKQSEGKTAIYSGDGGAEGCFYKFITGNEGLETGNLYVADFVNEKWLLIDFRDLSYKFEKEIDMLVRTREAAIIAGGTPIGKVGGISIHPKTGEVFFALKNGQSPGENFGSILKLAEQSDDPSSFQWGVYLEGGEDTGFVHPGPLAFDPSGNLWIATDIPMKSIGKGVYQPFGNNGLFVQPLAGNNAGKVLRVASAPIDARFGGMCFSPNNGSLFLSVQHPGASSLFGQFSSHWPEGGSTKPKSAVMVLEGDLLNALSTK